MSLLGFVVKRIIYLLCFCFCLIWDQGYSADCSDASGTVTISTSCTQLEISGDGSNVTVAAGVTVDSSGTMAVKTPDAVNVTITNNGTITADGNYGIRNTSPGDIYSLTNNGSIIAGAGGTGNHGIRNGGTITSLSNSGTISAATDRGITNLGGPARSWGTVTNSGLISAGEDFGIRNDGTIDLINNSGQISAGGDNGVWSKGTLTSLINTGTISVGDTDGIKNVSGGIIGTINNSGTISAVSDYGIRNDATSTKFSSLETLINSGTISASRNAIWNDGEIDTLTNSGTIKTTSGDYGIKNVGGTIGTLTNSDTISAGGNWGIYNTTSSDGSATITTLTNTGTISASGNNIGIHNATSSTITTLNNSQGASGSALTYQGKLPTNYNVIVNSTTDFGKTIFSDVSGQTNFGVHSGSTLSEGTYSSVLSGLTASNISSGVIGTHSNVNACSDVDAANATFSSNCAELDISGDGSDVTINSGITISGVGDYDWTLSNSSGTTWDLVSTAQLDDVVNTGTHTLLNNLGTITASGGGGNGIFNQGSFTTLTNKGLITSDSAHGIDNSGTIITFNNLQGASSSALTYKGKLPTNYNVIVKSKTDFGQTIFSDTSGATNFGIHSESILSKGTYSSVLSGLTASEIVSGTSGTVVSGAIRSNWALANNTGSEWDLVVGNKDITDDTKTSVVKSVKPNIVLGVNNLTSVTEVNFANMNTYDCDLFDKHKICVSFGGRHTVINSPKTKTNSMVLVGGYQVTDALRVGGFFHHNISHKTPASFKLSDKTPLLGGLVVWNEKPNRLGYQLKLANAFQQKYAAVTREVVGSSEEGKGQTVIEAKSFVAELQYGYQFNDNIILRPYFAARSAVIKQDGYTETGSSSPLSFNEIKDKSTTILPGLKLNARLSSNLSLKGSFGIEHDVHHSIDKLAPTGISGLSTVSLSDDFNQNRPVASLGFDYFFKSNHRLSFTAQYQELPYKSKTETNAYLYYTVGF